MRMLQRTSENPSDLVSTIHQIRRRWRYKLMLRGAVGVLGLGATALALSAWGLESWRFSPASIITFRVLVLAALATLTYWFIARPLLWRVSDDQVALYLEEHEPSLQAEIISAIEASRLAASDRSPHSAMLVDRLVASAVAKCQAIDWGRNVERSRLKGYAATVGVIALAAITLFAFGPRFLRHGLSALLVISRSVEAAAPYHIDVTPGNATVPRGIDQTITATLAGFDADQAVLMIRKSPDAAFERVPLVRSENASEKNKYEGMLFDLAGPIDYFVEAEGVKSPTYALKVVDLPYVQKLELELHFPAYTGLSPRKIEDGGDLAVLKGTEVRVKVTPTMTARGGQILVHDALKVPLTVSADGTLAGAFTADKDGFYRFELDAPSGEHVKASPQYTIDVLTDQTPTVSISKPGRDTSASPIEEVFVEARAEDDFGVRDLELVYSVNGSAEKSIRLFDGKSRLSEVTAGHTFYLEELDVKPGDFVSYYARAADNDVNGGKKQSSDIYFMQIRPLRKEFRRAQSDAGAGGGGGGGSQVGALSQQQRQIISATFNVNRDRKMLPAEKLRENSTVIALSQAKLRDQVDGLLTRMNSRLVQQDPSFKKIADLLPQAVTEMKNAEAKLQKADPQGALEPEQKALQILQRAEEEYEIQVQMGRQGGGGGGGQNAMAQDLADLFELELDKMANQYETAQRAQQQQSDQKLDELLEKLKELARRQEQEAERQRRRAQAGQSGGGGDQQRALADQVEEAARRLEQLSREENRPELAESARQLRQAADAMRQASANGQAGSAQAANALDKLQQAQQKMQQAQAGRAERDVNDALRQADEIAREQQQIAEGVKGLESAGDAKAERVQQLSERKEQLESKVSELEKQVERSATDLAKTEKDASRKLQEAATSMRENRLRDKIRYSRSMIRSGVQGNDANNFEQEIGNNVGEMQRKIADAASAVGRAKPDTKTAALDKARDLARGMESLDQRIRERTGQAGQQGQQGQQGRNGQQQGQQGRNGQQQGQQAQNGQQGRSGEQGQQGQGQQGQSGQQGQGQQGQQGQNGQNGQQGQGGQGGQNADGSRAGGGRESNGLSLGNAPFAGGGPGDTRPGGFSNEDIRQFRGELQRWTREAEQLRRMLQGEKIDPKEIDAMLRSLRQLDDDRVYRSPEELARLQAQVTDSAKRVEYDLRRRLEGKDGQVLLSGSDEVPEQFRKVVEQYYRSLSRGQDAPAPGTTTGGAKTPDKGPVKKQ
jgi:hypothetical protein